MRLATTCLIFVVFGAFGCSVGGCGSSGGINKRDIRPVDERRGAFRGVRFGDTRFEMTAALGERRRRGAPKYDVDRDGGPLSWRPPGGTRQESEFEYPGVVVGLAYGRRPGPGENPPRPGSVYAFIITDPRAETTRGVRVGDPLAKARRRYPGLRCTEGNGGANSEYPQFPTCVGRVAPNRYLGFSQNPIKTITLMTVPFE